MGTIWPTKKTFNEAIPTNYNLNGLHSKCRPHLQNRFTRLGWKSLKIDSSLVWKFKLWVSFHVALQVATFPLETLTQLWYCKCCLLYSGPPLYPTAHFTYSNKTFYTSINVQIWLNEKCDAFVIRRSMDHEILSVQTERNELILSQINVKIHWTSHSMFSLFRFKEAMFRLLQYLIKPFYFSPVTLPELHLTHQRILHF